MKRYTIGQFSGCVPDGNVLSLTAYNYAHWLNQTMGTTYVIALSGKDNAGKDNLVKLQDVPSHSTLRQSYHLGLWFDFRLHRQLRNIPFDLLHCHSPFSYGRYALWMARRRNIPVIATFHPEYCDNFLKALSHPVIFKLMVRRMVNFFTAADEVWVPDAAAEDTLRKYGYQGRAVVMETDVQHWENTIEAVKNRYTIVMQRNRCKWVHRQNRVPWPERIWPDPIFELNEQLV